MDDLNLQAVLDQLQKLGITAPQVLNGVKTAFDNVFKSAKAFAGLDLTKISAAMTNYNKVVQEIVPSSEALRTHTLKNAEAFNKISNAVAGLTSMTTKFDGFSQMAVKSGSAVNTIDKQFNELMGRFGSWGQVSAALLGNGFTKIAGMSKEVAEKYLENAASAQKLESTYMNLLGATGSLTGAFDATGKQLSGNVNDKVARFGANITQTAMLTGEATSTVADFAAQLYQIPGAMNSFITLAPDKHFDTLTAAMTAARGAGVDLNTVLTSMSTAYEDLGNAQGKVVDGAQKGIQMFALMSETSNKLGLRFSDTEKYLQEVASTFKFSGDNSEAASKLLGRFSESLQSTGLTAKASIDIIGGMTHSINQLSIGTKALISSRTGGPGGLQGAFQVENLVRNGKMDQVAQMLEKTLRQQFGGRIYTQEEAGKSPEAASQFMRQRSLIQSGAFGQLAKTDEQATRLLEALKAGPVETANAIKTGMDATKDVEARGEELQKKQVNILSMMNSSMDQMVALQQLSVLEEVRKSAGNQNAVFNSKMQEARDAAIQNMLSTKREPGSVTEQSNNLNQLVAANLRDLVPMLGEGIKTLGKDAVGYMNEKASTVNGVFKQESSKAILNKQVESDMNQSHEAVQRGRMQKAAQHAVQNTQTMKHEVSNTPLDVNITVSTNDNIDVDVQTNYPSANVRKQITSTAAKGYATITR